MNRFTERENVCGLRCGRQAFCSAVDVRDAPKSGSGPMQPIGVIGPGVGFRMKTGRHGAYVTRAAESGVERDDADWIGDPWPVGLQRAHIGEEVIELGIARRVAGVHLPGVEVPHELDRVPQ